MIDVEDTLRAELDGMISVEATPDWAAVLRAAGFDRERVRRRQRWLAVVVALLAAGALALATPLGGAIARGLDEFSTWLSGEPGTPVSEQEQRDFEARNSRSWLGFPEGTVLRRLLTREVDGLRIELLGFRSGSNALCLRLTVSGGLKATTKCAPLVELQREGGPARVLIADEHVGRGEKFAWYGINRFHSAQLQITAGIVADEVSGVVVRDQTGRHQVDVESNAFLYVAEEPEIGQRVDAVWARTPAGLVEVPFAPLPTAFGSGSRPAKPAPPAPAVERTVSSGSIGWLERHELRGEPLDVLPERTRTTVLGQRRAPIGQRASNVVFGRVLTPEPGRPLRIVLTLNVHRPGGPVAGLCTWVVSREGGAAGGCTQYPQVFARQPFTSGMVGGGSGAFITLDGVASDHVARLEALLADGQRAAVPLANNAFAVDLPRAKLPARLVAYDSEGRVISVSRAWTDFDHGAAPARGKAELLWRVTGPNGSYAELSVGPSDQGGECQFVKHFVDRQHTGIGTSCKAKEWTGPAVQIYSQFRPPRFVSGRVRADVETVRIRFADGATTLVTPKRGHVLYAVPAEHLTEASAATGAEGLDEAGRIIGRTSFLPPAGRG